MAVIRMAVPYTGMILSTRETAALRSEVFDLGISQISAGSRTNPGATGRTQRGIPGGSVQPGGHADPRRGDPRHQHPRAYSQFLHRLLPAGPDGADFMDLAKPGLIQKFCRTNAILTYKEYLEDYASPEAKAVGYALIDRLLAETKSARQRQNLEKRLRKIEEGQRDLYV